MNNRIKFIFLLAIWLFLITKLCSAHETISQQERKDILSTLRIPIEISLHHKIIFRITTLNKKNEWVFVDAIPLLPNRNHVDYKKIYSDDDFGEDGVAALLKKNGGKWQVIEYVISPTDIPYGCWHYKHKAPKSIFPSVGSDEDCQALQ